MQTLDDVARIALELPEVTEAERYGNRAWCVPAAGNRSGRSRRAGASKVFAWERPFSKADVRRFGAETPPDGPILAVRVADLSEKEAVLAANPTALFTIPHFDGFAAVLIQLQVVAEPALHEAVVDGWLACAPPSLAEQYLAP
jgi:hypothetical protein